MGKHSGNRPRSGNATQQNQRKNAEKKERRRPVRRIIGTVFLVIGGFVVVGAGAGIGYATALLKDLPKITPQTFEPRGIPSVVYDRNGKVIGRFTEDGDRQPISSIDQVSPFLVQAFVSAEDKTFYTNPGINPLAIGRALFEDVLGHRIVSGASTITQQTVKLAVFPKQQRTLRRKIQEAALAIEVNHILTKNEIMKDYMNLAYYGQMGTSQVYGVKTASEILFHKDPKDLTLAEAAFLAAIPNNPSLFSPYQYPSNTIARQHRILGEMLNNQTITQSQYQAAMAFDISKDIHSPTDTSGMAYPYIMIDNIEPIVAKDLVQAGLYGNAQDAIAALPKVGLKIYTSIDLNMQKDMDSVLSNDKLYGNSTLTYQGKKDLYEAGATIIDNNTGGILAIGGGRHFSNQYNGDMIDHSDLPRQPGSSIKPLVDYGPALQLHQITPATVLDDVKTNFGSQAKPYAPTDDENFWHGLVTVREALTQSLNVPAVEVLRMITPQVGTSFLPKLGISTASRTLDPSGGPGLPTLTTDDENQLSTAIGGMSYGLTVQQMTSAYTVFPNQGIWKQSYLVSKITDNNDLTLFQFKPQVNQVFSPQTSYLVTSILHDVVYSPTGTAYSIGQRFPNEYISGKTGTTDSLRNGWFVGYTQQYTMGLWMGYNDNQPIAPSNYNLKFSLWSDIMAPILAKSPPTTPFPEPSGIVKVSVCSKSGELPTSLCKTDGDVYSELFIQGTEPTTTCQVHVQALYTVVNGVKYLATTNTPANEIKTGIFLKPPSPLPPGVVTLDSKEYVPTLPDPRGGTILQQPTPGQLQTMPSPQNVTAALTSTGVSLSWDAVPGATGYTVWRASAIGGPYQNIAGPLTSTSYTDATIPAGASTLYYEVYAMSGSGVSAPSTPAPVQISATIGGNPSNTTGGTGGSGSGASNGTGLPEILWPDTTRDKSRVQ